VTARLTSVNIRRVGGWLAVSIGLSILSSELNKLRLPLPSFQNGNQISEILPKKRRLKSNEIDLSTQEGLNIAIAELNKADDIHKPKLKVNQLGQISYHYYRKEGEPEKTQAELDALVKNGKSFENIQQKIAQLLTLLADHNVLVVVGEPNLKGAAGEWDPSRQTIRITPSSLAKGSEVVLRILNHEAIHVAQSCRNGGINFKPKSLDVELSPVKIFDKQLSSDIYSQIGDETRRLESEAYSYEYSSKAARYYLAKYCKVTP
jgi:hypothetical protein